MVGSFTPTHQRRLCLSCTKREVLHYQGYNPSMTAVEQEPMSLLQLRAERSRSSPSGENLLHLIGAHWLSRSSSRGAGLQVLPLLQPYPKFSLHFPGSTFQSSSAVLAAEWKSPLQPPQHRIRKTRLLLIMEAVLSLVFSIELVSSTMTVTRHGFSQG